MYKHYDDKLNLTTKEKSDFKDEYSRLFPNQELIAVENKLNLLNDQFSKIKSQISTTPAELKDLKNEITVAEKNKRQLETQISNFNKDLESYKQKSKFEKKVFFCLGMARSGSA